MFKSEQRITHEGGRAPTSRGWLRLGLGSLALVVFASLAMAVAGAATFTASLDRDTINFGETATLSLAFSGGQPQDPPSVPEVPNLQIAYIGPSSQFSVINGQVNSSITYNFTVAPRQPGDYTIPAISLNMGGQHFTSQPLTLKVLKPSAPPPDAVNSGSQLAFLRLLLPKKEMYVGEMVAAQLQVYILNRVQGLDGLQITSFPAEGFNVGKMVQGQRHSTQIGNAVYTVVPVSFTLRAVKGGSLTLGPLTANATLELPSANRQRDVFDPFGMFGRNEQRQVVLATELEKVQSLPLPQENVPAGFNGAVGAYTLSMSAGPTNVAAGDPITVKVQISGRGSLDSLKLPE
ncbi:MAG: BatD family protein, partial [Limisphaerales bacterium]